MRATREKMITPLEPSSTERTDQIPGLGKGRSDVVEKKLIEPPLVRRLPLPRTSLVNGARTAAGLGALIGGARNLTCAGLIAVVAGCTGGPGIAPSAQAPILAREIGGIGITLAPTHMSAAQKHEFYAAIVRAAGGTISSSKPTILALRGLNLETRSLHETHSNPQMDDTIVVLHGGVATEFIGSTHAGQKEKPGRNKPVGMIREGNYITWTNGSFAGGPSYWLRLPNGGGALPGYRDHNKNGRMDEADWTTDAIAFQEVLVHPGWSPEAVREALDGKVEGRIDNYVNSIACLNVRFEDYPAFVATLGGAGARPNITLVNALHSEP